MSKLNLQLNYKTCGEQEKCGTSDFDNKLISTNKNIINEENNINKNNFGDTNKTTNNNSLRRTSSLSNENNNNNEQQKQQQRRKRSNEPSSTKTIYSSSNKEKQQRKAVITFGISNNEKQDIEKSLEKLTKENDLLKTKLEEQIRLNSVIVANPSLINNNNNTINLSNRLNNNKITSTTEEKQSLFSKSINLNSFYPTQNLEQKINKVIQKEIKSTESSSNISSISSECINNNNNILQKSERSAFSVIRAGTLVGNDNKQQESTIPFLQSSSQSPPINNSFDLRSSLNPFIPSSFSTTTSPLFFPFYENREQLEFIRLASQLIPFSLFSQNQQYYNESNNNSIFLPSSSNQSLTSSQQKFIFEQSNRMIKDQKKSLETTSSNSLANTQYSLNDEHLSQPLILDTLEETELIRKENSNRKLLEYEEYNKNYNKTEYEETQEIPLDFSVIKCGNKKHLVNKNNRPKSVICTSSSTANNEFLDGNKSSLNIYSPNKNKEKESSTILEKAFESLPPFNPHIQGCSHSITTDDLTNSLITNFPLRKTVLEITGSSPLSTSSSITSQQLDNKQQNNSSLFRPLAHFLLQKQEQNNKKQYLSELLNLNVSQLNSYLTEQTTTKIINEENQQQQTSSSQQCTSTTSDIHSLSTTQSTTLSTNANSSSSNSMLGTLLAAPNKRQISPTVPASRTELFSGLTAFQRNEIKTIEKENKQQLSNFSSSTICQVKKSSTSSSSDSEHSINQHSPTSLHSLHSLISRPSPTLSTFPGAGSSTTIGGESDRTRRGGSFSPSGNSGFSGDDSLAEPLQHHYQANLLNNGQHLLENSLRIGENIHQQLNDNGNYINGDDIDEDIGSLRVKLKNNEELERYMDRRRRNNEAAKRCRANRRAVFEYRSRRAQLLEAENGELRQEMIKLNNELEQLKALIAANAHLQQHNHHHNNKINV